MCMNLFHSVGRRGRAAECTGMDKQHEETGRGFNSISLRPQTRPITWLFPDARVYFLYLSAYLSHTRHNDFIADSRRSSRRISRALLIWARASSLALSPSRWLIASTIAACSSKECPHRPSSESVERGEWTRCVLSLSKRSISTGLCVARQIAA